MQSNIALGKILCHRHFKDLDMYESGPEEYCAKEHKWFNHADAEKTRTETRSFLLNTFQNKHKQGS